MEKLPLKTAVQDRFLDASFVEIEEAIKYTTKKDEYESEFANIGKERAVARKILIAISGSSFIVALVKSSEPNLFALFIISAFIIFMIYATLKETSKNLDSSEKLQFKNQVIDQLIENNFKELYNYAKKNKHLLIAAFDKAKVIGVSEDKLESYIKGFILQRLDELDLKKQKQLSEIDAVINYEQSRERKEKIELKKIKEEIIE